jgi:hypothetical protein
VNFHEKAERKVFSQAFESACKFSSQNACFTFEEEMKLISDMNVRVCDRWVVVGDKG